MKVLVACEFSGVVRDAFTNAGHDAASCDLLPSETQGEHYQGDVFDLHLDNYDLLIAFPPCRYLTYAANSAWNDPGRAQLRLNALYFFWRLWSANVKHICIENPSGIVPAVIAPYTQIIHPYFFGDREMKRTCLWLKNLPPLTHAPEKTLFYESTHTPKPEPVRVQPSGKPVRFVAKHNTKSTRARLRSITFPGIAQAMAEQWTAYFNLHTTFCPQVLKPDH